MIYLVHAAADPTEVLADALADDVVELTEHLLVIDTQVSRSQLYHRLKPMQPRDAPLLVAELSSPPKVKGMAPGSVAWLRDRFS